MLVTVHGVCELVDGIEGQIADCIWVVLREVIDEVFDAFTGEIRVERGVEAVVFH